VNRRSITELIKKRAAARQEALYAELEIVLKKDVNGMRTRMNMLFDECQWTDRSKRAWVAVNVTYCNAAGKMVKRLATTVDRRRHRTLPPAQQPSQQPLAAAQEREAAAAAKGIVTWSCACPAHCRVCIRGIFGIRGEAAENFLT